MARIQRKPKGVPLGIRLSKLRALDRTGWVHVVVRAMIGLEWMIIRKGELGWWIYFGYIGKDESMRVEYCLDITPRINRVGVCMYYWITLENRFREALARVRIDKFIGEWIADVCYELYKRR